MQGMMMALFTLVMLILIGCSSSGSGPIVAAYNTVYGVNAFSADENISLYVGDETIETVLPYDQNASIIEKAVGGDNVAYYSVASTGYYGDTVLQNSRTYFYAATDCNDSTPITQTSLFHIVENDTQINVVNTSSSLVLGSDINISIDGTQINGDVPACVITTMLEPSAKDQNISISLGGSLVVWQILPADVSADIVIYDILSPSAAIISLPRLTPDVL